MIYHKTGGKKGTKYLLMLAVTAAAVVFSCFYMAALPAFTLQQEKKDDYIKWVEFNIPYAALQKALRIDVEAHQAGREQSWIELLAYLGAKYGGDFSRYQSLDMDALLEKLKTRTMEELTRDMKYYDYYFKAYSAVLGGMVGEYEAELPDPDNPGQKRWQKKYGLMAFSPIAKSYPFQHYDDFGNRRTYGFARPHLGHDMMAATGTPVIAVESGTVEALGWNQYGGWRIGIRSFDGMRYYYYAHLRKNRPYAENLKEGMTVTAGDVIGYVGRTGYSATENVNNIEVSHLHFGLQLIFDESQKEGDNEIWVDLYALSLLLNTNKSETYRVDETKEYYRLYDILIPEQTEKAEK